MTDTPKRRTHDSIEATAAAVRRDVRNNDGSQMTHEQARARVVSVVERAERRDSRNK